MGQRVLCVVNCVNMFLVLICICVSLFALPIYICIYIVENVMQAKWSGWWEWLQIVRGLENVY
jgi:hypothetical protein